MKTHTHRSGFSLVEVTVALGIASFCLLALVGLLPAGVNINRAAIAQATAANLSTSIAADLQATPATSTTSPIYSLSMVNATTVIYLRRDGSLATSAADGSFCATVVTSAGAGGAHTATTARILIVWPAAATAATAATSGGTFDTVIALNRN